MGMISRFIDKLRDTAMRVEIFLEGSTDAIPTDTHEQLRNAADIIRELRDDLRRANCAVQDAEHDESMAWDRVRKAEAENAKLRDMLARYIRQAYVQACDKGNPITVGIIENEARELGIEVPHD